LAGGRIEIGVEHALRVLELKLEARSFAHLQCRRSKDGDQLGRGEADQQVSRLLLGDDRRGLRRDLLFRPRGAGGHEEGECKD